LVPTARTAVRGQPLGELGERLERVRLRAAVDALVGGQAAAQAHHLAHRVERVDLPVDHAADLEVEAVRAEVDRGERFETRHVRAYGITDFSSKEACLTS
jgi:hypothetical protein